MQVTLSIGFQFITGWPTLTYIDNVIVRFRVCSLSKTVSIWTTGVKRSTWGAHEFQHKTVLLWRDNTKCCRNYTYLCNLIQSSSYWVTRIPNGLQWWKNTLQLDFVSRKLCHMPSWMWSPLRNSSVQKMCFLQMSVSRYFCCEHAVSSWEGCSHNVECIGLSYFGQTCLLNECMLWMLVSYHIIVTGQFLKSSYY